jgi:hypothetical protein
LFSRFDSTDWPFSNALVGRLVMAAVIGLVSAGATIWGDRQKCRVCGSLEQYAGYARALRTGEPPASIEPYGWRDWLGRSRNQNRSSLVSAGVLTVFGVLSILIHQWASVSVFLLIGVWGLASWWVRRGRIARLATAVDGRAAATATD